MTLFMSRASTRTESSLRKVHIYNCDLLLTLHLVSRIEAVSEVNRLEIQLDVNTDIYPMDKDGYYAMCIASSVNTDGSEEFDIFRDQHEGSSEGLGSLLDQYQYVMHGKVFKYNIDKDNKM